MDIHTVVEVEVDTGILTTIRCGLLLFFSLTIYRRIQTINTVTASINTKKMKRSWSLSTTMTIRRKRPDP